MGLPDGWVTAVPGVSRNDQLKILGNGVVPLQAALAVRLLLPAQTPVGDGPAGHETLVPGPSATSGGPARGPVLAQPPTRMAPCTGAPVTVGDNLGGS